MDSKEFEQNQCSIEIFSPTRCVCFEYSLNRTSVVLKYDHPAFFDERGFKFEQNQCSIEILKGSQHQEKTNLFEQNQCSIEMRFLCFI